MILNVYFRYVYICRDFSTIYRNPGWWVTIIQSELIPLKTVSCFRVAINNVDVVAKCFQFGLGVEVLDGTGTETQFMFWIAWFLTQHCYLASFKDEVTIIHETSISIIIVQAWFIHHSSIRSLGFQFDANTKVFAFCRRIKEAELYVRWWYVQNEKKHQQDCYAPQPSWLMVTQTPMLRG